MATNVPEGLVDCLNCNSLIVLINLKGGAAGCMIIIIEIRQV
jgi:hypothetical protein